MLRSHFFIWVFFGFMLTLGCSSDEQPQDTDMQEQSDTTVPLAAAIQTDVSYGSDPQQVYDLYLPAGRNSTKTKVLVLVHGGGWASGDKQDMTPYISWIQSELPQYAIMNINYVLADATTPAFPNQFLDLKAALNQVKEQASELEVLPEFGLIGVSAGAHISLMTDYVYDNEDLIKMVCSIVGPTDFTDPFYSENPEFQILLAALTDESAYASDTNYAEVTSPVYQVNSASAPTIMFYGNTDPLVPITNGLNLEAALANANISHSFTIYEGGHGDDWSQANYENLQMQLIGYISQYLAVNP
ncbi:alpha/beta hydrolase [Gilvibacter sp. SZ-19]|jgi:acetyl esterase/lipase|uniref:alpha/beta hydrolase n=1 Tax=Gilvibacter sp. SZ-19 TaxID=754429 RepID=UPI000B54FBCC|nr:alpha/beta hydrolase [Gilvibacter sp. SZ-19]ARV12997.1 alpha/beta hydrolase [Gilvibacter sp. SZ-19]